MDARKKILLLEINGLYLKSKAIAKVKIGEEVWEESNKFD